MTNFEQLCFEFPTTSRDSIIDIAVVTIENWQIVDSWTSLVKPESTIPSQIEKMTGIDNKMVANYSFFDGIAEKVNSILKGKLFVAHNARFDYAFIKNSLSRAGISFSSKVICTAKLSKQMYPQCTKHSLDGLVERFYPNLAVGKRAMDDVKLVYLFLTKCRDEFGQELVDEKVKLIKKNSSLPSYLKTPISNLPESPGVYLFYGEVSDVPIYIGKSVNLKKRVMSHFSSDYTSSKELKITQQLRDIKCIETVGELGALLLESQLIKKQLPVYNKKLRRTKSVSCFKIIKNGGFYQLKVINTSESKALDDNNLIGCFKSKRMAESILRELVSDNKLCPKLCGLDRSKKACFHYQLKKCKGACVNKEDICEYNQRVQSALSKYRLQVWPYNGAIGIKEHCKKKQATDIHIFDQWRYLVSVKSLNELKEGVDSDVSMGTTFDEIKIIQSYIKKVKPTDIIIL